MNLQTTAYECGYALMDPVTPGMEGALCARHDAVVSGLSRVFVQVPFGPMNVAMHVWEGDQND